MNTQGKFPDSSVLSPINERQDSVQFQFFAQYWGDWGADSLPKAD